MNNPQACYLNALGMVCTLGDSLDQIWQNLHSGQTDFLTSTDRFSQGKSTYLGEVKCDLPDLSHLPARWHSRNNQLLVAALQQFEPQLQTLIEQYGQSRVAIIIGTSTSGIAEGEVAVAETVKTGTRPADFDYKTQEIGAPATFLADYLKTSGPAYTISTACTSGAKALASARRLLQLGICDVAIAGGVDSLCKLTVNGFGALDLVSETPCNPCSLNRKGISIGEGSALFLLTRENSGDDISLCGVGETSDAHHISSPDPEGKGAYSAMAGALENAAVSPESVDYLNLHGTGTQLNDSVEAAAINRLFGDDLYCSSTKGFTGHTLGAAGAIDAGLCWLALKQKQTALLPPHQWDGVEDPELANIKLVDKNTQLPSAIHYAMSNSFAFGGNNIALLLGVTT